MNTLVAYSLSGKRDANKKKEKGLALIQPLSGSKG